MTEDTKDNPLDDLLRARFRIEGAGTARLRIAILRMLMQSVDAVNRVTTRQPFFAMRETEQILRELDGRTGVALIQALLEMNGGTKLTAHGLENIPEKGPVIIASTHPIGTFDYIAHAGVVLGRRPDLKVVAGRESERFLGTEHLIAVDLDNRDNVRAPSQTIEGMKEHLGTGGALLIFGSGRVPDMQDGLLVERPWRTGVTRVSEALGAPIVPASADMRNSRHYYRTRRLARLLSGGNEDVGRRISSLRYVSELIAKLGGSYDLHYAPPMPPGTDAASLQSVAEELVPGLYRPV